MNALLVGYDLIGFIDGTKTYPASSHSEYNYRMRQDQLILHAIISTSGHRAWKCPDIQASLGYSY